MSPKTRLLLTTTILGIGLGGSVPAFAQDDTSEDEGVLEEILVTATRRGNTRLMTTPISMTVLSAKSIEEYLPRDLNDIAAMVPALSAGTISAFKSASFAMRGVSETTIIVYKESPIGVTIDDFALAHVQTQNLEMFDIEQIEVLRGPQGTLFGKNTTGGVINVRTKRPDLNEGSVDTRFRYGSFDTKEVQFALNVPIAEGKLGFRAAAMYLKSDGYYKNGYSYGPLPAFLPADVAGASFAGDGRDLGGDDVFSGRFKLMWAPSDDFNALLQYEMIRDNGDTPPIVNESPPGYVFSIFGWPGVTGDPLDSAGVSFRNDAGVDNGKGHQVDIDGVYLNMEWDIGDYTVHSVTGYRHQESRLPSNYTGTPGPITLFDATRDDDRDTYQQEVRLSSNSDGPFNFVTGLFLQKEKVEFCVMQVVGFLDFFGLGTPPGFFNNNPLILCNSQKAEAAAIYADGTYDISDRLHLSGGLRYTYEKKEWAGRPRVAVEQLSGGFDPAFTWRELGDPLNAADFDRFPTGVVRNEKSWEEPTWRINLAYDASENTYLYALYARGFKSGGYNDQLGTQLNPITDLAAEPTRPEIADSFEIGLKSSLMDRRANIALNGFFVTYKDAQRTFNVSFPNGDQSTLFFNAAEMEVWGIEFEGTAALAENFLVRVTAAYLDAKFIKFEADTNFDGIVDVFLSGKPVTRAPKWQLGFDASYTYPLGNVGDLSFNARLAFEDRQVYSYSAVAPEFDSTLNSKTLINANITYTDGDDRYFVRLVGKNLTDKRYRTGTLSVATLWIMSAYGQPRYFGIEFGTKFGF